MDDMGSMNLRPVRKTASRVASTPSNVVSILTRERLRRFTRLQSDRAQQEFAAHVGRFDRMAGDTVDRIASRPDDAEAQARRLATRLTITLLAAERAARRALVAGDEGLMDRVHAQMTRLAYGAATIDQRFRHAGVSTPMLSRRAIASLDRVERMAHGAGMDISSTPGMQVRG